MTGNTRRELSRKTATDEVQFTGIDFVRPPIALPGQRVQVLSNGKWEVAEVHRVQITRPDRARLWTWTYHVTIRGVHVSRRGNEGMIMAIGEKEQI